MATADDRIAALEAEVARLKIKCGEAGGDDEKEEPKEQVINPMEVRAGADSKIDYMKIVNDWATTLLKPEDLERAEKLVRAISGKGLHPMLKRGLYYCHRDFKLILDSVEKGENFYLYTGRGPSSGSMHLGHLVPFMFTKYLQEAFDAPLVIQITDDEKFFWKGQDLIGKEKLYAKYGGRLQYFNHLARENAKDIIAFGFDISKTFIFIDTEYIGEMYPNVCKVQEKVTYNTIKGIFGFSEGQSVNCGKIAYPAIQAIPSFSSTFRKQFDNKKLRCLIPCAIDQDPYFRMTRDVADRCGEYKTSTLYSKFIPGLTGPGGKMSSSIPDSTIFLSDTSKDISRKISKAFSGGQQTVAEHRAKGANLEVDVAFQYLSFFLEDDAKLAHIAEEYQSGRMMSGQVKKECAAVLTPIVETFQKNRKLVTDEMLDAFMTIRRLRLPDYKKT